MKYQQWAPTSATKKLFPCAPFTEWLIVYSRIRCRPLLFNATEIARVFGTPLISHCVIDDSCGWKSLRAFVVVMFIVYENFIRRVVFLAAAGKLSWCLLRNSFSPKDDLEACHRAGELLIVQRPKVKAFSGWDLKCWIKTWFNNCKRRVACEEDISGELDLVSARCGLRSTEAARRGKETIKLLSARFRCSLMIHGALSIEGRRTENDVSGTWAD